MSRDRILLIEATILKFVELACCAETNLLLSFLFGSCLELIEELVVDSCSCAWLIDRNVSFVSEFTCVQINRFIAYMGTEY